MQSVATQERAAAPEERLWTLNDVARFLNVKPSWVYDRTRSTAPIPIPHFKIGKYLRFLESDVRDWLRTRFKSS